MLDFSTMFPKREDRLCRCGCGEPLTGRRTSWATPECEAKCVQAFKIARGDSQAIRAAVLERDRGICALCGLDTEAERRKCRYWPGRARTTSQSLDEHMAIANAARRGFMLRGFPSPEETWWHADHVVPLVEGGRNELANFRTLCVVCHKNETRRLAGRRCQARRDETRTPFLQLLQRPDSLA